MALTSQRFQPPKHGREISSQEHLLRSRGSCHRQGLQKQQPFCCCQGISFRVTLALTLEYCAVLLWDYLQKLNSELLIILNISGIKIDWIPPKTEEDFAPFPWCCCLRHNPQQTGVFRWINFSAASSNWVYLVTSRFLENTLCFTCVHTPVTVSKFANEQVNISLYDWLINIITDNSYLCRLCSFVCISDLIRNDLD